METESIYHFFYTGHLHGLKTMLWRSVFTNGFKTFSWAHGLCSMASDCSCNKAAKEQKIEILSLSVPTISYMLDQTKEKHFHQIFAWKWMVSFNGQWLMRKNKQLSAPKHFKQCELRCFSSHKAPLGLSRQRVEVSAAPSTVAGTWPQFLAASDRKMGIHGVQGQSRFKINRSILRKLSGRLCPLWNEF